MAVATILTKDRQALGLKLHVERIVKSSAQPRETYLEFDLFVRFWEVGKAESFLAPPPLEDYWLFIF